MLIEGGGRTLGEAFDRGLVDRVVFYLAPVLLGGPIAAVGGRGTASIPTGIALENVSYRVTGGDMRIEGTVRKGAG